MQHAAIESILGAGIRTSLPLHGGCIGEVRKLSLDDGRVVVAKLGNAHTRLDIEGKMLNYLAQHTELPVPDVLHAEPGLLLLTYLPGQSSFNADAQRHAAELLAALHAVKASCFGLHFDTLIGGLHQPNTKTDTWVEFFGQRRLLHRALEAEKAGQLPASTRRKVEALVQKLEHLLPEPEHPSLLHGDVWTTNVLAHGGRITGFVDPAIYYGHPEIELAFTTLFGTFGSAFFQRYTELRTIAPGFWEERRDLYNLYPLLVHVQLFGGGYVGQVENAIQRWI